MNTVKVEGFVNAQQHIQTNVEVSGSKAYKIHPDGKVYQWTPGKGYDEVKMEDLDPELIKHLLNQVQAHIYDLQQIKGAIVTAGARQWTIIAPGYQDDMADPQPPYLNPNDTDIWEGGIPRVVPGLEACCAFHAWGGKSSLECRR